MSFRIDETAQWRYVGDKGQTVGLAEQQQKRFQAALDEALEDRSKAGGEGQIDETGERLAVVERGDNLTVIAEENLVTLDELTALNPHLDPNQITTGEVIFLPNTSPELAANTANNGAGIPQGEQAFITNLRERGYELEDPEGPTDFAAEQAELTNDVREYLQALPADQRQDAAQRLLDRDWRDAGPAQEAINQAAQQEGLTLESTTHSGPDVDSQVRDIVADAQGESGPVEQLKAFNEAYNHASPEVQNALLQSEGGREILNEVAGWTLAALQEVQEDDFNPSKVAVRNLLERLETVTEGMNQDIATALVTQALPGIEAAYQESLTNSEAYPAGPLEAGQMGAEALMWVTDRIAGTTEGDRALDRFAEMGFYESSGVRHAIANGANPAYAIRYAAEVGSEEIFQSDVLGGIDDFREQVAGSADAYSAHVEELNWLSANHGVAMTEEQLQQAIADYRAETGADWEGTEQELKDAMAADGKLLLEQLGALTSLPPELSGQQEAANAKVDETLGDSKSFDAIRVALQQDDGQLSEDTLRTIGTIGRLSDRGRKLAEEVATQILRREVLPAFADFDPNDAASVTRAKEAIQSLNDRHWPTLLGVSEGDLEKATKALEEGLPQPGDTFEQKQARLAEMNRKLNEVTSTDGAKTFNKTTFPGQLLRTIGVAGTGVSLLASAGMVEANPNLRNQLKVLIDSAGLAQKTVELMEGLGALGSDTRSAQLFGSSAKPAVKFLGVLGSTFDFVNAYEYYQNGDHASAGLSAVAGVGGVTAALGTGTIAGPIGLTIVGGAVIAQMIWNDVRNSNIHMNDVSAEFLQHAGFSEDAARALVDQSGDGYSPVPILVKYAELKGLDMDTSAGQQAFVDWINNMPVDKLATLRDNLHHTLDDIDGGLDQFGATAEDDVHYLWSSQQDGVATPYKYVMSEKDRILSGDSSPSSAAQVDATLQTLGIVPLVIA